MTSDETMKERYFAAMDFTTYLESVEKNRELWHAVYERVTIEPGLLEQARKIPGTWYLLVLSEDWCGDAINLVPVAARLVEEIPGWDLRVPCHLPGTPYYGQRDSGHVFDSELAHNRQQTGPRHCRRQEDRLRHENNCTAGGLGGSVRTLCLLESLQPLAGSRKCSRRAAISN